MIKNKILISGLMIIFGITISNSYAKINDLLPVTSNNAIPYMMINDKTAAGGYIKNTNTGTTNTGSIQTYSYHKNNTGRINTGVLAQAILGGGVKKIITNKIIIKNKTTNTKKSKIVKIIKKKK